MHSMLSCTFRSTRCSSDAAVTVWFASGFLPQSLLPCWCVHNLCGFKDPAVMPDFFLLLLGKILVLQVPYLWAKLCGFTILLFFSTVDCIRMFSNNWESSRFSDTVYLISTSGDGSSLKGTQQYKSFQNVSSLEHISFVCYCNHKGLLKLPIFPCQ